MVQLREKELDEAGFEKEAVEILQLCHRFGVPFIVNDNVELAQRVGADGVHIGQADMQMQQARRSQWISPMVGISTLSSRVPAMN